MASYSWTGVSGNWKSSANWTPAGGPPTASDIAAIGGSGTYTVTVNSADVASSLTVSDANATLNDAGASASLTIGGTLSVSDGELNVASRLGQGLLAVGALNLSGGALTVDSGGQINLSGTLSQTGGTLTLNGGGTIAGGTIDSTAGTLVLNGGTLSAVTFDGPLNLTAATVSVHLANGTTVVGSGMSGPGTINDTGASAYVYFDNTQTVSNETINLGNSSTYSYLYENDTAGAGNQVLTLPDSVTVNVLGDAQIQDSGFSGDGIVNQGVIDQTGSAGGLVINGNAFTNSGMIDAKATGGSSIQSTTFTNNGTIDVANSESVTIAPGTFTTTASSVITIEANSSVTIRPTNAWTNLGSMSLASGGRLILYGSMSAASLGTVTNSGGSVLISGTWDNTGGTLDGSASFGQLALYGGTITGGAVTAAGVAFTYYGGALSGVTFDGPLTLASTQALHLTNGTTVVGSSGSGPGTIGVTGNSTLYFDENLAYAGNFTEGAGSTVSISSGDALTLLGTTYLSGNTSGAGTLALAGGATTIASGASITDSAVSVSGSGTSVTLGENLTYAGDFSASAGATLNLSGDSLTLRGSDSFAGAAISGSGTLIASGTTSVSGLTVGGSTTFSVRAGGTLTESGGSVTVGDDTPGDVAKLSIASTGTFDILDNSGINRDLSTSSAITSSGLLEKTGGTGTTSFITPKVTNNGVNTGGAAVNGGILVSAGTIDFEGAVHGGTVATPGTDTISGASSVLEFDSSVANAKTVGSQNIVFSGGGTLDLAKPLVFYGEISDFAVGDTIDLLGRWAFSGISDVAGVTTLTLIRGKAEHAFTFVGDYAKSDFDISSGTTTTITHT